MIAFSCPHCSVQLQVRESLAGKTAPCPGCNQTVQAPTAGQSPPSGSARASSGNSGANVSNMPTLRLPSAAEDTDPSIPKLAPSPDFPFLACPEEPDELGRLGPYAILKILGTGAMGMVFQAQDLNLKRLVALKVMKPSMAASPDSHLRFLREAQLAASIDHEHIVTIYQVGEDRGVLFMAMKLLEGKTLEARLRRSGGSLPLPEVLRIGREIAEGLQAAHARGLVHRDIKPANIWLDVDRERVKIVDFGLARGSSEDARLTHAGAVIGTPSYMAPEQANAQEVDSRCDLFSLGALLYEACTGELPFAGKDTLTVLAALATKTPKPPNKVVPSLPRAFSDLVMKLLVKNRDNRIQTAQEVVEAIEAIESGKVEEPLEIPPQPASPAPNRQRVQVAAPATPVKVRPRAEEPARAEKKGPKKVRPGASRRDKRQEAKTDVSRLVLLASLVLFIVAVIVLVVGIIRRVNNSHTAMPARVEYCQGDNSPKRFANRKMTG